MNQPANKSASAIQKCIQILEKNGGKLAEESRSLMFADPGLLELKEQFQFISKNWRDQLTPSLISLSCQAVGGKPNKTHDFALTMSLINLSFFLWDDIIDRSYSKSFKPTLAGKYGSNIALVTGGIISAKAFFILNNARINQLKKKLITNHIWNLLSVMTKVEAHTIKMRNEKQYSKMKLWKIETESIDPEICLKIGSIIGDGSEEEIENLGRYGKSLGIILGLIHDFHVGSNLTLELAEKIKQNTLPYCVLLASEQSKPVKKKLDQLIVKEEIDANLIKVLVEEILKTKILEEIKKKIDYWVEEAKKAIGGLDPNRATLTLKNFVELQPRYFIESISAKI